METTSDTELETLLPEEYLTGSAAKRSVPLSMKPLLPSTQEASAHSAEKDEPADVSSISREDKLLNSLSSSLQADTMATETWSNDTSGADPDVDQLLSGDNSALHLAASKTTRQHQIITNMAIPWQDILSNSLSGKDEENSRVSCVVGFILTYLLDIKQYNKWLGWRKNGNLYNFLKIKE